MKNLMKFALFLISTTLLVTINAKMPEIDATIPLNDQLLSAVIAGDMYKVHPLISRGADINYVGEYGATPLIMAAYYCTARSPEDIQILLELGANKSYRDEDGKTAYDYIVGVDGCEEHIAVLNAA